jgi:hypothetical protein
MSGRALAQANAKQGHVHQVGEILGQYKRRFTSLHFKFGEGLSVPPQPPILDSPKQT